MTALKLLNFIIILTVMIFLVKYLWDLFFGDCYEPPAWHQAGKNGQLSRELMKASRNYPDKIRFYNWWLQIQRLKAEGIKGSFAELGVYRGESAGLLHLMDPSRQLHLFDTFEGFHQEDLKKETGEAATYTTENFADTSISKVLKTIGGDPEKLKLHPGRFPVTAAGLENETFALVNIDADLHDPVKAGLEFFYPRLVPGGVIFIHDYNYKWPGLVEAVDTFVAGIPENPVLVPDPDSTVMIIRNKELQ